MFLIFDVTDELRKQLEAKNREMSDLKKEQEAKNVEKNEQYEKKIGIFFNRGFESEHRNERVAIEMCS